jgi:hypothetical protein
MALKAERARQPDKTADKTDKTDTFGPQEGTGQVRTCLARNLIDFVNHCDASIARVCPRVVVD